MNFDNYKEQVKTRIDAVLLHYLPKQALAPQQLHRAMHYAVLTGGKRVRALLVYATGEAYAADPVVLDKVAAAVELIHAYSLVHDDLPAMDDDDLRRGKPACHKAFDPATAILVGDALQSLAFALLAEDVDVPGATPQRLQMIAELAHAIGSCGMAGGQSLDLQAVDQTITLSTLEDIHQRKTGALIKASVRLGAVAGGCDDPQQLRALTQYADCIGLAFQLWDDVLGVEAAVADLGKPSDRDRSAKTATYPSLMGIAQAKQKGDALVQQALTHLQKLPMVIEPLQHLAQFIISRGN